MRENHIGLIVNEMPNLIEKFNAWGYRKGPDLYFYLRVISERRRGKIEDLIVNEKFIELIYAALVSWDMNSRGAKMKYFDDFFNEIKKNKNAFIDLSTFKLESISEKDLEEIKSKLVNLYSDMKLMKSGGCLVSNSKVMHFILPELVMPMDRTNTLKFFYENTNESLDKFIEIFESSWKICRQINLRQFLDDEWNQTVPKVIDNAIISKMNSEKVGQR